MNAAKVSFLKALVALIKAVDFLLFTAALTIVGMPLLERFFPPKPGETYAFAAVADRFLLPALEPLARLVRAFLPHSYDGQDMTVYILGGLLVAACFGLTAVMRQIRVDILVLQDDAALSEAEEAARLVNAEHRLAALEASKPSDREKVLELYAQTKKILDEQKRTIAFLAVDVVDSTGMKHGEDAALAERDFRQYRKLVEAVIAQRKGLKAAWTPDGVMMCFATVESAALAGQDLIRGLAEFNRSIKSIKADFRVRCGLNAGLVLYDDETPMEQMSDGAIDLAGHMQKHAEPNVIFAPQSLLAAHSALGFVPAGRQVDGVDVVAWRG